MDYLKGLFNGSNSGSEEKKFGKKETLDIVQEYGHGFGWKPSLPDHRDRYFSSRMGSYYSSKEENDLRELMPEVYDQGRIGSCTSNAICAAFEYDQKRQKCPEFMPSRLFNYYYERLAEGSEGYDAGANIRDGMKSINTNGICPESFWQYKPNLLTVHPSVEADNEAKKNRAVLYERVNPVIGEFKTAIDQGYPVIFGFSVPKSFMNISNDGIMKMPTLFDTIIGGHAVLACGYDDKKEGYGSRGFLLVRNSWGKGWGADGYFWMPYKFLTDKMCDDCWILETIEEVN